MKYLLLIIAHSVGGVEKRFYNYSTYVLNASKDCYTIVLHRSLVENLGNIPHSSKDRIIKYGRNWSKKNFFNRYLDYIHLLFIFLKLFLNSYDACHFVTPSSLKFHKLIRAKQKIFSSVGSQKRLHYRLILSSRFRNIISGGFKIDCLDSNIKKRIIEHYPHFKENVFVSPCSFITTDVPSCKYEEKENLICFAGRLEEFKGINLLLEVAYDIISKTEFNILILGKGSYKDKIDSLIREKKINNRIRLEYVDDPKAVFVRSKIFLSLQREENYPSQSLMEAMACKNVIVATDVGLTRQIVKDEFGILISRNSGNLLNAILLLNQKKDSLKYMGDHASTFLSENHNIEIFHKYLISLYQ